MEKRLPSVYVETPIVSYLFAQQSSSLLGSVGSTGQFRPRKVYPLSIYKDIRIMNLQVAKWGDSLALRIPNEYASSLGVKEGDSLEATLTVDGGLSIHPRKWSREVFARELETAHEAMPMGKSVVDELRRGERY